MNIRNRQLFLEETDITKEHFGFMVHIFKDKPAKEITELSKTSFYAGVGWMVELMVSFMEEDHGEQFEENFNLFVDRMDTQCKRRLSKLSKDNESNS